MVKKTLKRKKLSSKDFAREIKPNMDIGEFQMKENHGKHYIHGHPLCSIKGKPYKSIVESGDILVCPLYLIESFMDKFVRIDAGAATQEEIEMKEQAKSKPRLEQVAGGYNVLNSSGVRLNNKPLNEEQASELLQIELEGEEDEEEE